MYSSSVPFFFSKVGALGMLENDLHNRTAQAKVKAKRTKGP